jgi:LysM repeat protein
MSTSDDWEVEVPQIRMSRAFVVMLALHLVAVGGLFAFHTWGRDSENSGAVAHDPNAPDTAAAPPATQLASLPRQGAPASLAAAEPPIPRAEVVPEDEVSEPEAAPEPSAPGTFHTLQPGETRLLVSTRYERSVEQLEAANPDASWEAGSRILIPDAPHVIGSTADPAAKLTQRTAPFDPSPDPAETPDATPEDSIAQEEQPLEHAQPAEPEPTTVASRQPDTWVQDKSRRVTPAAEPSSKPSTKPAAQKQPAVAVKATPAPKPKPVRTEPAEPKAAPVPVKSSPKPSTKKTDADSTVATKPKTETPARSAGQRTHVVVRGDTVYNVARRYGFPAGEIMRLNGLSDSSVIRPGEQLKIPVRR